MNKLLIELLKNGRIKKGLNQTDVAKLIGVKGNTISNYENGVSEPDIDTFCRLCDIYDLDPADALNLAYGISADSDSIILSPDETVLVEKYRCLDKTSKKVVDYIINLELKRSPVEDKEDNIIRLPFSDNKVSAGTGYFLFDAYPDSTIDITLNKTTEKANECIAVSGDSMEPMFYDGDILLVKRQANIDEGQIGIFVKDGQGYVKKKGFDRLISLNPEYGDILPSEYDDINCYGLVLGKVNKEWIK